MADYSKLRSNDPRVQAARKRAGRIVNAMNELATLVQEAWDNHDHRTLGYETWQSYTIGEFGHGDTAIKARQVIVAMLRGTGLSQRAIAAETGTSVATVNNDLADVADVTAIEPTTRTSRASVQRVEQPAAVTGLDGRVRAATRGGMTSDERRARRRERDTALREAAAEAEAAQYQRALEENHRNTRRSEPAVVAPASGYETGAAAAREELTQRNDTRVLLAANFNGKFRQWLGTLDGDQLTELENNWENVMDTALNAMKSWITAQRSVS